MNQFVEGLLDKILDAPVGNIVAVLDEIVEEDVKLEVVEQNSVTPNQFVRRISITVQEVPVIKASVRFDATVLPKAIMVEILKRRQGIGDILRANDIDVTRNVLHLNRSNSENEASREYEIIHNGSVWFTIAEEIRLGNISPNKNR